MKDLRKRLQKEILVYDGGMGTLLQASGRLKAGSGPEELNLTDPAIIKEIHVQYVEAGAQIIETNSFGASKQKLSEYGLGKKFEKINYEAVNIAKEAAKGKAYVAFAFGPLGTMLEPMGPLKFEDALGIYGGQIKAGLEAEPDLILIETMSDIREAKAAVIAARELTDLPIQVQLTYENGERTVSGTPPEAAAAVFSSMDVDIIGTNCGSGPEDMLKVIEVLSKKTNKFISVLPNAGIPELVDGKTVFKMTSQDFGSYAEKFKELGVNLIGGCCGTTPDHIKAVKKALGKTKPAKREVEEVLRLASRTKVVEFSETDRPLVIGERINPTGRKQLSKEIAEGNMATVRRDAAAQTKSGAHALDINVSVPDTDEISSMIKAVREVEAVSDAPLVIDSPKPAVIEAGLREASGKVLINSVSGEENSIKEVIPLAKKYGAALLGLTLDESGIPKTMHDRIKITKKILKAAKKQGISESDLVIDPLTLTISAQPNQAFETLSAVKEIKEKFGLLTSLGVSNVSFGLPNRHIVNANFLSLAVGFGLGMAIINPLDEEIMSVVKNKVRCEASEKAVENFLKEVKETLSKKIEEGRKKTAGAATSIEDKIKEAILYGDKEQIVSFVEEGLKKGFAPLDINRNLLIPAMEEVGKKFGAKEFFLPQVILSAETMQRAFSRLEKEMEKEEIETRGKVVIATVEGDVHDIGKNIVASMLKNHGYEVVDLGKNVPCESILSAAKKEKADVVGLSSLMTTTLHQVETVVKQIKKKHLNFKTIIGGAVVNRAYAEKIGATGYARDAAEAVAEMEKILEEGKEK